MTTIAEQALLNAVNGQSTKNYNDIFNGFEAKGIDLEDIKPRENVFTFHAWKQLNRQVNKGEHGVKVVTWIPMTKKDKTGEKQDIGRKPRTTTVFHISQTSTI